VVYVRSLAPALSAGCTTVGKLPGFTAQTNARTCGVMSEVKTLPRGVINVFSEVHSAARVLIASPGVPVISLTAGSATGRAVMATGAKHLKRFGGELGGKTPVILFEDADLDKALPKVEKALTVFAGQFCMTGSRLLVQRPILETVRKRLAVRLEAVKVVPASDPASDMGPMIIITWRMCSGSIASSMRHRRRRQGHRARRPGQRGAAREGGFLPSDRRST
jgi:betaine-aldehyde dehydrogenase